MQSGCQRCPVLRKCFSRPGGPAGRRIPRGVNSGRNTYSRRGARRCAELIQRERAAPAGRGGPLDLSRKSTGGNRRQRCSAAVRPGDLLEVADEDGCRVQDRNQFLFYVLRRTEGLPLVLDERLVLVRLHRADPAVLGGRTALAPQAGSEGEPPGA